MQFQFTPLREGRLAAATGYIGHGISIHAPPRGATVILRQSYLRCFISIHAPPRGATLEDLDPSIIISIHAPPRGATAIIVEPCQRRIFQFTPLREGRLAVGEVAACQRANFNSRPSARGDPCPAAVQPDGIISIHAPPRGATGFVLRAARRLAISIHAPPRGATDRA